MNHANWACPKCTHKEFETDQFRATGGMFAKVFDVQNKRFTTGDTKPGSSILHSRVSQGRLCVIATAGLAMSAEMRA